MNFLRIAKEGRTPHFLMWTKNLLINLHQHDVTWHKPSHQVWAGPPGRGGNLHVFKTEVFSPQPHQCIIWWGFKAQIKSLLVPNTITTQNPYWTVLNCLGHIQHLSVKRGEVLLCKKDPEPLVTVLYIVLGKGSREQTLHWAAALILSLYAADCRLFYLTSLP